MQQFLLAAGLSYEKSNRATNITYTSMLFALASDKIFFGTTPGVPSVIGSMLIMGSAIVMTLTKPGVPANAPKDHTEDATDEERGLMTDNEVDVRPEVSMEEVQMRVLR